MLLVVCNGYGHAAGVLLCGHFGSVMCIQALVS